MCSYIYFKDASVLGHNLDPSKSVYKSLSFTVDLSDWGKTQAMNIELCHRFVGHNGRQPDSPTASGKVKVCQSDGPDAPDSLQTTAVTAPVYKQQKCSIHAIATLIRNIIRTQLSSTTYT